MLGSGTNALRGAALAAALLGVLAGPAATIHAAEPTKDADLSPIDNVFDATLAGTTRYAAVGCDGLSYPAYTGRIHVIDPRNGATAWDATLPSPSACLWSVLGTPDLFFTSGYVEDDDDNGDNLIVQAYRAKDGTLVWQNEFEAPNPKQDVVKRIGANEDDLRLVNGKLLVWFFNTGDANRTVLLRLDAKTGALLPNPAD